MKTALNNGVTILPSQDVLTLLRHQTKRVSVIMLDPWYNRGVGGVRSDYATWLQELVALAAQHTDHIFLWGFPELVYPVLDRLPKNFSLLAWLTWYYKNCPSVIRGWRSAQSTCLHLVSPDAKTYPENFLNEAQVEKRKQGKMRYMPGPPSVLEVPLNIGFVGKNEQTGHPAQKPEKVIEPLILMATRVGDTVLDPMCGSGTTGAVCQKLGRKAILCDSSNEYLEVTRKRLSARNGFSRQKIPSKTCTLRVSLSQEQLAI
ncbi:MAG TPA: site-specific DNA-methyltransferase [Chthoniobacterales bacterium]|nr:site-specific DNA-methyltransferase [Chthoniobacterales bacterium]